MEQHDTNSPRNDVESTPIASAYSAGDLPFVPAGTQLETSGVYLDLDHLDRGPFKALPGQEAGSGNRYVARRDVDLDTWNRLVESQSAQTPVEPPVEF